MITNPAPATLATCRVMTDSGIVTTICEPINEHLAITPTFGMDAELQTRLGGDFVITHRPTGHLFSNGPGCIECCRSAGKAIARLGLDFESLTGDNASEWLTSLPDEQRLKFAEARQVNWNCVDDTCAPWPADMVDDVVEKRVAHRTKLTAGGAE